VKSYAVKLRWASGDAASLGAAVERAGTAVRWVRSVYVPERDTCLLVFEAPTAEAVERASRRAGLTYDRITEGGEIA
jgi:hypothetical protein